MTVTSVAFATLGMCDCTVDNDVGMGDFSFVQGTLHVCGHAHARSHVSPGMDCESRHRVKV